MSYQVREPLFIAIEAPGGEPPSAFSPKVMDWGDGIWLIDLRFGLSYLRYRARRSEASIEAYLRSAQHFELAALSRAVWACHPWVSLLGLYALRRLRHQGRLGLTEPRHSIFYQKISWDVWQEAAHAVGQHWHRILGRAQAFDHGVYQKKLLRLRRFAERVGLRRPHELERFEPESLQRRFGKHLTRLIGWQKSSGAGAYDSTMICSFLDEVLTADGIMFPWQPWVAEQPLKISRTLDYGLSQWESLVPLLTEDAQRLNALLDSYGSDRIVSIQWRLRLQDLSEVSLPIRFRRPYHLGSDGPHFKTLLQQAYFSYVAWQHECHKEDCISSPQDYLGDGRVFISWELEISERRRSIPHQNGAEGGILASPQERQQQQRLQELRALENLLPNSLQQYQACPAWVPEASFRRSRQDGKKSTEIGGYCDVQRGFAGRDSVRPAFMYSTPQKLLSALDSADLLPLERVTAPWWRDQHLHQAGDDDDTAFAAPSRQYFRWESPDGKSYWVYQTGSGKWFVHGIFA